jgi:hypothetical protein
MYTAKPSLEQVADHSPTALSSVSLGFWRMRVEDRYLICSDETPIAATTVTSTSSMPAPRHGINLPGSLMQFARCPRATGQISPLSMECHDSGLVLHRHSSGLALLGGHHGSGLPSNRRLVDVRTDECRLSVPSAALRIRTVPAACGFDSA